MMDPVIIPTRRLLLKGVSPQIIHELFRSRNKEEIKTFFGTDEAGFERLREMHEEGMETHRLSLFFFLLIEKDTKLPIGECGFHTWNKRHRRAEIYYTLSNDIYKRKGFMTEALAEAISYAFEQMDIYRIEALVARENTPSVRLLKRYGFSFEGVMRADYVVDGINEDSDCYSLLKPEWKATSQSALAGF